MLHQLNIFFLIIITIRFACAKRLDLIVKPVLLEIILISTIFLCLKRYQEENINQDLIVAHFNVFKIQRFAWVP